MAFPSGTATAQLISVLHDVPPPGARRQNGSLRQRRGYTVIQDGEEGSVEEAIEEEHDRDAEERDAVRQGGWFALGWSFAASALMTVS